MNDYSALELFQLLNQQDECDWIEAKGGHESSRSVMETVCSFHYVAGTNLEVENDFLSTPPQDLTTLPNDLSALPSDLSALPSDLSALPNGLSALPNGLSALPQKTEEQITQIIAKIDILPQRVNDKTQIEQIITELCAVKAFKLSELAKIIGKSEKHLFRKFIRPLLQKKTINYLYPEMTNHPEQAYLANKLDENN